MRKRIASAFSLLSIATITAAGAQVQTSLPEGRYIYLGADAQSSQPKALTITPAGAVIWQGESSATPQASAAKLEMNFDGDSFTTTRDGKTSQTPQTDLQRNKARTPAVTHLSSETSSKLASPVKASERIENVEWPIIKFFPKAMPGSKDGAAQLTTTAEFANGNAASIEGKYKLILLRVDPIDVTVELLDGNGFRLNKFTIAASEFEIIDGTDLIAARGQFSLSLADYRAVRDFSLMPRTSPVLYSRAAKQVPAATR